MTDIQSRPCKACGARIFFVETAAGRPFPLDVVKKVRYRVEDGKAVGVEVYTTHFETCPNAKEFRRK
jgi:hypothetical protein